MKKRCVIIIVIIILLILTCLLCYNLRPQFFIKDFPKNIDINYQDSYKVNYGNICYGNKIRCKKVNVKIIGSVDSNTVGNYNIKYIISYKKKKIKLEQVVNVIDKVAPQIDVLTDKVMLCPNGKVQNLEYKAIDNYDGDLTANVQTYIKGSEIILSVVDSSDNKQEINIKGMIDDNEKPQITLNGKKKITLTVGDTYKEQGATSTDNCDEVEVIIKGNVDSNKTGTYKIEYIASDSSGNSATVTREVKVIEKMVNNPNNSTGSKIIYLTFDDGPSGYTEHLLDILNQYNVKATFFVTGKGSDAIILREYQEGHTVALHTYSHDYSYVYSSLDNYYADLYKIQERVSSITGYTSYIVRFPGGSSNTISHNYDGGGHIISQLVSDLPTKGFSYFDWNVSSGDAGGTTSSDGVYNNVVKHLKSSSSIVLQHDTKKFSIDAVERIIQYGLNNGYTFKALDISSPGAHQRVNN